MPEPVFLISLQRTGTNLLRSLIDSHPQIAAAYGEPFELSYDSPWDYYSFAYDQVCKNKELFLPSKANAETLLNGFLEYMGTLSDSDSFIVDIKYNSLHLLNPAWWCVENVPFMLKCILARGLKVIHLTRDNLLEVYCSKTIADTTGVYTVYEDAQRPHEGTRIEIDCEKALQWVRDRDREVAYFNRIFCEFSDQVFSMKYTQILRDDRFDPQLSERLADFFGTRNAFSDKPRTVKQNRNLQSMVSNFDELSDVFRDSEFWEFVG